MATSLSNLAHNILEGIHKIKCKDCECFLQYESVNENLIKHKYLSSNKDYSNKIDEELKRRFKDTFKFPTVFNNSFLIIYFTKKKCLFL